MTPRQLPGDVRHFVNRHAELGTLAGIAVDESPAAVVTVAVVTGTAGVGKTSLALHWAHSVRSSFPAGDLYVNLRGYDAGAPMGPDQVLDRFLRDLGVPPASIPVGLEDRAAMYRSVVADRRILVVLDNAATVAQVRPLLPGTAGSLVVVTSRGGMSGLVAREGAHLLDLGIFPEGDAVTLLRVVTSGYRRYDRGAELSELARLCARLPLALRIAAQRAIGRPMMPLGDLIADLRDESARWDVLTEETEEEADAMRSVFSWSYRALPEPVARLFGLLGLHPGNEFGLPAVAALAGEDPARVRRALDVLVGAHLLEQSAPGRYEFHDLLRAYAAERVRERESEQARAQALERVLSWYLHAADAAQRALAPFDRYELTATAAAGVVPPVFTGSESALRWYRAESDNLVAATRAAAETGRHPIAWRLAVVLRSIYMHHNAFEDWATTARIGIDSARAAGERDGEAEALDSLGKACFQSMRLDESRIHHRAALEIRRELGDRFGEAVSINALGLLGLRRRRLHEARDRFQDSAAILRELGDRRWTALVQGNLAEALCELGRFPAAAQILEGAVAEFRALADRGCEGNALYFLAWARRGSGDPTGAGAAIEAALAIAADEDNRVWQAHWLVERGNIERASGRSADALATFRAAADIQGLLGDRSREAVAWDGAGEACRDLGRYDDAAALHRTAIGPHRALDDRWHLAMSLDALAEALSGAGGGAAAEEARACREEASRLLAEFDDPRAAATARRINRALGTTG